MPSPEPGPDGGATGLVLASAVLFGTTGTAQALGPAGASAASVGSARLVVGGLALVGLAAATGRLHRGRAASAPVPVTIAAVGVALYQLCFFAAVARTGVALGTVLALGSAPAFTGLLGLLRSGRPPGRRWMLATFLAVAGAALLLLPGGGGAGDPIGVLLALGAGLSYALYTVAAKELLDAGRAPDAVMAAAFGLGAVLVAPVLVLGESGWLARPEGIGLALYLGLVPTALAYALFARGLATLEPARVATLTLAEPLTAGVLGVLLLGERPAGPSRLGGLLVLLGLVIAARPERPRKIDS